MSQEKEELINRNPMQLTFLKTKYTNDGTCLLQTPLQGGILKADNKRVPTLTALNES